jgi:hypothetical protein
VLEPDEIELLLKACHEYQAALPTYLQATKPEVDLLESIRRKLLGES